MSDAIVAPESTAVASNWKRGFANASEMSDDILATVDGGGPVNVGSNC